MEKNLSQAKFSFQVEINHASEIDEIFDAISYRKGASVIRMLQSYLGAESFQVGNLIFMIEATLYIFQNPHILFCRKIPKLRV